MSLIVKASSSPRRGPKKDARPAQVNRQVEICPVVKCSSEVSRMHAATHLSGIFDDQLKPTEELLRRRISVLKICESRLLGSVSNLSGLVDYVNDLKQVCRGKCQVSMRQTKASHGSHVQAFRFMVGPGHCPMISKFGPSLSKAVGPVDPSFFSWDPSFFSCKNMVLVKIFILQRVYGLHKTESTCRLSIH